MELKYLTSVFWKADTKMHFGYFFLKEIFFIEKQDNGGGRKVLVITDTVEQVKAFMHSVLLGIKVRMCSIIICKILTSSIKKQDLRSNIYVWKIFP